MTPEQKKKVSYMYVNSNIPMEEIARALKVKTNVVVAYLKRQNIRSLPPSDEELACNEPTEGFLSYLREIGYEV